MVNSYGQKPMEKPWIITHGDFMEFFCKGGALKWLYHASGYISALIFYLICLSIMTDMFT